jgi:ABC-type branched-subunit amino acid transport system permease subunit
MGALPAAVIGALIAGAVGALLSLPIRRLGGVWTAIGTLAFAYFFDAVVVNLPFVGGNASLQGTKVPRPAIGSIDFASDKSFLVLCVIILVVVAVLVANLKSGTLGKSLLALQGSEVGAQSIGISPARARLVAFSISAFIASLGGALLAMSQNNVNYGANFSPFVSLVWVVVVVTLGVRTISGAIQAALAFVLFEPVVLKGAFLGWILRNPDRIPGIFPISGKWVLVMFGLGTILYARHPEGLVEYGMYRRAAKAQRRRQQRSSAPPAEPDVVTAHAGETVA